MPSPIWAAVATLAVAAALLLGPLHADASRRHTVRAGQTLGQIAERYRVSVDDIKAANEMGVRPGGMIMIHGQRNSIGNTRLQPSNWTNGCISLKRSEMEELYKMIPIGTRVSIRK